MACGVWSHHLPFPNNATCRLAGLAPVSFLLPSIRTLQHNEFLFSAPRAFANETGKDGGAPVPQKAIPAPKVGPTYNGYALYDSAGAPGADDASLTYDDLPGGNADVITEGRLYGEDPNYDAADSGPLCVVVCFCLVFACQYRGWLRNNDVCLPLLYM